MTWQEWWRECLLLQLKVWEITMPVPGWQVITIIIISIIIPWASWTSSSQVLHLLHPTQSIGALAPKVLAAFSLVTFKMLIPICMCICCRTCICDCDLPGLWGTGNGTTSYSENIGAIGVTKVDSCTVACGLHCGTKQNMVTWLTIKAACFFSVFMHTNYLDKFGSIRIILIILIWKVPLF